MASGRISRMRASATRIFQPPESAPTSPSIISWLKLEAGQHFARRGLQRVAVELLEAALHLAIALDDRVHVVGLVRIGHRGLELAQFGRHRAHRAGAVHHLGDGAAARHFADILAEIADGDAAIDRHLALVGRSWPVIMRNSVVLPAPLGPTRPTFSPFWSAAEASMNRS